MSEANEADEANEGKKGNEANEESNVWKERRQIMQIRHKHYPWWRR